MTMLLVPFVYILRCEMPFWVCGRFYDEEEGDSFDVAVMEPFLDLEGKIRETLNDEGNLVSGPYRQTDNSIVHDFLLVVFDDNVAARLEQFHQIEMQPAAGEIFELIDHVFYADFRQLVVFENEVLLEIVTNRHGAQVRDLSQFLLKGLREILRDRHGISDAELGAIINRLQFIPPTCWTWETISRTASRTIG